MRIADCCFRLIFALPFSHSLPHFTQLTHRTLTLTSYLLPLTSYLFVSQSPVLFRALFSFWCVDPWDSLRSPTVRMFRPFRASLFYWYLHQYFSQPTRLPVPIGTSSLFALPFSVTLHSSLSSLYSLHSLTTHYFLLLAHYSPLLTSYLLPLTSDL